MSTQTPVDRRFKVADVAESQIGVQEDDAHQNKGSAILKYQQSTNLDGQGWPWCAAFVDWCVGQSGLLTEVQRPKTASAFGLIDWAQKVQGAIILYPGKTSSPQRGDIVVYSFSHCGIVSAGLNGVGSVFVAVEGNTNKDGGRDGFEVAKRMRDVSSVKAFIRLPA